MHKSNELVLKFYAEANETLFYLIENRKSILKLKEKIHELKINYPKQFLETDNVS